MEVTDSDRSPKRACRTSVSASPPPEDDSELYGATVMDGTVETFNASPQNPSQQIEASNAPRKSPPQKNDASNTTQLPSIPGLGIVSQEEERSTVEARDEREAPQSEFLPGRDEEIPRDESADARPNGVELAAKPRVPIVSSDLQIGQAQDQTIPQPMKSADSENNYLLDAVGQSLMQEVEIEVNGDTSMGDVRPSTLAENNTESQLGNAATEEREADGEGGAEWEVDSSPYESSSDSSSSDDSSEDSDEEEDDPDYAMLDPEEQARILMQGDGGSDDEGHSKGGKTGGGHLRTVNEKPEEIIPKPDIVVTPDMAIEELGSVEVAIESTVLIKGKTSGEYRVLENGSVLCLQDRTVVGVVAETLGRVQEPLYTVRFTNDAAIQEAGLAEKGTRVFYVEKHSTFVFTQPLKAIKGSDASNVNDEEVGDEEMEFSDDEAEAEHKRQLKNKRQNKRDARNGVNSSHKTFSNGDSGHTIERDTSMYDDTTEINYDDVDSKADDGYTPLARPSNLHEMMNQAEPPTEGWQRSPPNGHAPHRGDRGRGRGHINARGHRGRGRGDGGRGGGRDRRNDYSARLHEQRGQPNGFTLQIDRPMGPPAWSSQPLPNFQQSSIAYGYQPPNMPPAQQSLAVPVPQPPSLSPQNPQHGSYTPSPISPLPSQQFQWPPVQQQPPTPSSYPQQQYPIPPPGSHVNPAFFTQGQPQFSGAATYSGNNDNSAAYAQVQAQLEMLRRFNNNNTTSNNNR